MKLRGCVALVLAGLAVVALGPLTAPPLPAQDSESNEKKDDGENKGKTETKRSVDEAYVFANLEKFLSPTSIEIGENDIVTMTFDFRDRREEHGTIFSPNVSGKIQDGFRWSLDREYIWNAGLDDRGIRVSDNGMALLDCWFTDSVEAEIKIVNGVNFSKRMHASVIFCNDKGVAVGSNLGTQCAMYQKGRPRGTKGELEPIVDGGVISNKLVVRDGMFEAHRNSRKKAEFKYPAKSFSSGRVGFAWGGNLMAVISELKVTGKIDAAKMAKVMQRR